jgi:hypothetical protein
VPLSIRCFQILLPPECVLFIQGRLVVNQFQGSPVGS